MLRFAIFLPKLNATTIVALSLGRKIKKAVAVEMAIWYNSRRLEEISFMNGKFKFTWYRYFGYFAQSGCAHA